MGFKSKVLPATEVFAVNGGHCLSFKPKSTGPSTVAPSSAQPRTTQGNKHLGQHINIKG
ncbi:MAG: hypothetical protein HQ497_06225 [SAR86 cluster bacterium]|uniref:Uncharacterized protein n=1 Tax=SAR86 cluster bacterium TaxID=2030880 RepID=A0A972VX71_9GAMM|nr:hypothetical protein [SAR86 cluster bacterium]